MLGKMWEVEGNYIYILESGKRGFPKKWQIKVLDLEEQVREKYDRRNLPPNYPPHTPNHDEIHEAKGRNLLSPSARDIREGPVGASALRPVTGTKTSGVYEVVWRGDSMEPRYSTGDRLIVEKGGEVADGDLVVTETTDGMFYFKLCHRVGPGRVVLTSYNPVYPPIELETKRLRYLHPVLEVRRLLRGKMLPPGFSS